MSKLIKVTKKHIQKGGKYYNDCPVALAIKDVFPDKTVSVDGMYIFVTPKNIKCPRSVSRFVNRYDDEKSVKPFNFILKY